VRRLGRRELLRIVRDLKTELYTIRSSKVVKYWKTVGKHLDRAIELAEELETELRRRGGQ
jgi:hypothetical protein